MRGTRASACACARLCEWEGRTRLSTQGKGGRAEHDYNNLPFSALGSDQNNQKNILRRPKRRRPDPPPLWPGHGGLGSDPKPAKNILRRPEKQETQPPRFRPKNEGLGSDQKPTTNIFPHGHVLVLRVPSGGCASWASGPKIWLLLLPKPWPRSSGARGR